MCFCWWWCVVVPSGCLVESAGSGAVRGCGSARRGFTQMANCKLLEEIGRRCASTSVFVNAHHSIGIRALLLFGTQEQKQIWLPKLVTGEQLGAFALTEKEA